MPEGIKKDVTLNVKSNLDKVLKETQDLYLALKKVEKQINDSSSSSLKEIKKQSAEIRKRIEAERALAEARINGERAVLALQKQQKQEADEIRKKQAQMVENYNLLKRGDLFGLLKSAANRSIDKRTTARREEIDEEAADRNAEIRKKAEEDKAAKKQAFAGIRSKAKTYDTEIDRLKQEIAAKTIFAQTDKEIVYDKTGQPVRTGTGEKRDYVYKTVPLSARIQAAREAAQLKKELAGVQAKRNLLGSYEKIDLQEKEALGNIEASAAMESTQINAGAETAKAQADLKATAQEMAVDAVLSTVKKIGKGIVNTFKQINNLAKETLGISFSIKDNFMGMVKNVSEMLSMTDGIATFATRSSLITNASAREQQMKFGLSDAANYALTQTREIMNLRTDEDLMYMNREQVQLFRTFMGKYETWYNQLQSSGVLQRVQEMQLDFAMFKQELAVDFMKWFAENKTTLLNAIKNIAKAVMWITEALAKITEKIVGGFFGKLFGWNSPSGTLSDTMSDYVTNSNTTNNKHVSINVNQQNTSTGVLSDQSQMEKFFGEQMEKLSRDLATQLG